MAIDNKDKKILNVPHLRFPEFSGEWVTCTLGDITSSFNLRNKDEVPYPMYSVTNNRGFIPQSEQFEDREMIGEDAKAYKIIHKDDFAYNPARINVGSIAKYNGVHPCMISSLYVCFKAGLQVDKDWLMQLLKTSKMNFYYNINGEGGVRVYLFYPNFARIRTSYPATLTEQKKIAHFLSLLDERIATQNKIIEKLQSLIKGLAVQLTQSGTPNIRLCDCLECHSSTLQENCVSVTGSYPVYGATGLIGYTNNYAYNGESILIVKDGSGVGSLSYVNDHFSVIGTLNYLTAKENYSILYLYYALMAFNFTPYITGMAIPHIYFKDYGKAKLFYPSIEKRIRIASLLHNIDQKLVAEQNLVISLSAQKSYLLRMLFI